MEFIKWVCYIAAACVVLALIVGGIGVVLTIVAVIAGLAIASLVITFIALCIKEYFESPPKNVDK